MLLNCQESCNNKPGVNKAFCATIAVYLSSSQNYIFIWVGIGIYKRASHQFWIFNFSSMILSTKPGRKQKKYWYKHYHSLFTIHNSSILEHLCNITRQFYWHSEVRKIIQNIENKHRSVKLGNSEFGDQESKAKTIFCWCVTALAKLSQASEQPFKFHRQETLLFSESAGKQEKYTGNH